MRYTVLRIFFLQICTVCAFLCISISSSAQGNRYTDSIFAVIKAMPDDTAKIGYINRIYNDKLWNYDLPEAYNQLKFAARLAIQLKADSLLYKTYRSMSGYCMRANAQDYAIANIELALEIAKKMNDSTWIASCWGGMAKSLEMQGEPRLALSYYQKALPYAIRDSAANLERIGRYYTFIGWCYDALGMLDSAIHYQEMGRAIRGRAKYHEGVLSTNASLMGMYMRKKQYDKVREVLEECIYINDTLGNKFARQGYWNWFGALHEANGNLDSALWYLHAGVLLADSLNDVNMKSTFYQGYAALLVKAGRKAEAYDYFAVYSHIADSVNHARAKNDIARAKEIFDVENKNLEIEKLQQETTLQEIENAEKDKQRAWLLAVLSLAIVLVIVALFAYRQKRKSALVLKHQKDIIEEKNHDITDSIQYAKRIQQAILPSMQQIKTALPDSFVYFSPKDIVSGDFFWFSETPSAYYLAVVDCTGHGVPGAMMSMIGHNFLGQIVNEKDVEQPAEILNGLHRKVIFALNKDFTSREMKDGMDVALLRIDKKTRKIIFCGAVRPLYVVTNGKLAEIKGDIYSVGGIKDVSNESFTQHEVEAPAGSCIYLFSDGYADQFGGPKGKKFKYKQLREVLAKNAHLPMEEQRTIVENTFVTWKSELEQVDDVCVVGLRV